MTALTHEIDYKQNTIVVTYTNTEKKGAGCTGLYLVIITQELNLYRFSLYLSYLRE